MSTLGNGNPRFRWDGTVTLGSMLAAVVIVVPMIGSAYLAGSRIDRIEARMLEQTVEFKELRGDVGEIKIKLAEQDGMRQRLTNVEMRLYDLEKNR